MTGQSIPFAEDVNYWKTGQSSPEAWISRTQAEIRTAGGRVLGEAFGADVLAGRAAFMLEFELGGDRFRAVWPVLPTRAKGPAAERAARIQAATMLYHDVKARAVSARVLGARAAFFTYLLLPDGRAASQAAAPEIAALFPRVLLLPGGDQ